MERLDKILAHEGFGTRRDVKKIIRTGVVTVNGKTCKSIDAHVDEVNDTISVNGVDLQLHFGIYLMMNKPQNIVSSSKDGLHETVFDLLDERYYNLFLSGKLHLVGRLDIDTEGFILITDDGLFTHNLISPKKHISKTYYVELRDAINGQNGTDSMAAEYSKKFSTGLSVPQDGTEAAFTALPSQLEWINDKSCYLTIYEGKYHQVKRMFTAVGNKVTFLKRTAIGEVKLDESLTLGQSRELTSNELLLLNK